MTNRLLLNLLLLVTLGLGFVGITSAINMLANTQSEEQHEFSYVKRMADNHWNRSEFEQAAHYYKQLAQGDEWNCNAQFLHAFCLYKIVDKRVGKLSQAASAEELDLVVKELDDKIQSSIDSFVKVTRFTQFRHVARVRLSLLHGLIGNREKSLEYAVAANDDDLHFYKLEPSFRKFRCVDVFYEAVPEYPKSELESR